MEIDQALKLVQGWSTGVRDTRYTSKMQVDAQGGFLTEAKGAIFRYQPETKTLLVSGVLAHDAYIFYSKHPDFWKELIEAGKREYTTLGEGEFELYTKPLLNMKPEIVLLTKKFTDDVIEQEQFILEVRWLLTAATYWRTLRRGYVLTAPVEKLIQEAPLINERMLRERPRPW